MIRARSVEWRPRSSMLWTPRHGAGLVHRDIKPANILFAGHDDWRVGDFGIAKGVSTIDPALTATGLVIGITLRPNDSPAGQATPSGDLYAVGIVLHEALIGDRAKHGDAALPAPPASRLPPLEHRRPPLPRDLDRSCSPGDGD